MTVHLSTLSLAGDKGTPTGDGARYTSMVTWWTDQSALNSDLTGQGDQIVLEVYNDFGGDFIDSGAVPIAGATTDPVNNVTIRPAAGQRHNGTWDSGFRLLRTANFSSALSIDQGYTVIEGIQCEGPGNGSTGITITNTSQGVVIDGCLASGGSGGTNASGAGIAVLTSTGVASVVRNCLILNGRAGVNCTTNAARAHVQNNTIINCNTGVRFTGTVPVDTVIQNNMVYGSSAVDYEITTAPTTGSNNASSDATAVGTNSIHDVPSTVFTDFDGGDYSGVQGSVIDDAGANLSGQFATDIIENIRNGWDIGAWNISGASTISFDGGNPIGNISTGTGSASIDLTDGGTRWTGDLAPFDYEEIGSALTGSGLSISSAGALVGDAVAGVYTGVAVRGNDTGANTADSNTFNVTVSVADSITIVEGSPDDNFVYPRDIGGNGAISRTVNYTGSPATLEYRAIKGDDDSTVIVDWTVFDSSPAGGTSALLVDVPARTYPMRLEVRLGDNTSVTATETTTWRIGLRILALGGLNASNYSYADPVAGGEAQVQYRPTWETVPGFTYPTTEGAGEKAAADLLANIFGCSIITVSAGIGGSSLLEEGSSGLDAWESAEGTLYTDLLSAVNVMTGGDNALDMIIYMAAEGDYGLSGTDYTGLNIGRGLNSLFTNLNEDFQTVNGGRVPVVLDSVPAATSGTAIQVQSIRDATLRMVNADPSVVLVDTTSLAVTGDSTLSSASQATFGGQAAAALEASGPVLIGVETNETNDSIILHFDSNLDDSITSYNDLYLRVESNSIEQSFSGWDRTGIRQATVILDAPLTDPTNVGVYLGYGLADSTGADVPLSVNIPLSGSGGNIKLPCHVFSGNLYGIV